jgi:hypothetical protein
MIHVKNLLLAGALALFCTSCNSTTSSISEARAEAPIRQACPAFRTGNFSSAAARTYGAEQITTFQNGSNFQCRCIAKTADQLPVCNQVRPFSAAILQEG